ncbi:Uncharacterised protein [Burkholderia pseudomallei]|nr:Uncharacterised protein [Burkholderia pseudomallei]
MKKRTFLKNQLINAWTECVKYDYPTGVINGERALQACLYHRLINDFKANGMENCRRIFIEPTIDVKGRTSRRIPDMMICDTNNVIAIFELKFHPRVTLSGRFGDALRGGVEKDLDTLLSIAQDLNGVSAKPQADASHIEVSNERYLGVSGASKAYGLASNLMLVWAGIYKRSDRSDASSTERLARVFDDAGVTIQGGFLELHAQTQEEAHPVLVDRYSGWKTPRILDGDATLA